MEEKTWQKTVRAGSPQTTSLNTHSKPGKNNSKVGQGFEV